MKKHFYARQWDINLKYLCKLLKWFISFRCVVIKPNNTACRIILFKSYVARLWIRRPLYRHNSGFYSVSYCECPKMCSSECLSSLADLFRWRICCSLTFEITRPPSSDHLRHLSTGTSELRRLLSILNFI